MCDFQRELQMALLTAGQFDHAYKELRAWMDSVNETLDEVEPVYGDPKVVEIELAKLRVSIEMLLLLVSNLKDLS